MSTYIKGNAVIVDIWDGTIYRPVVCATSNSITHSRTTVDAQTKCNPGLIDRDPGTYSYEISFEGLKIDTTSTGSEVTKASFDFLEDVIINGDVSIWRMSTGITDTPYRYGTAVLTEVAGTDPSADENATFSGALSGIGKPTTIDPNA